MQVYLQIYFKIKKTLFYKIIKVDYYLLLFNKITNNCNIYKQQNNKAHPIEDYILH